MFEKAKRKLREEQLARKQKIEKLLAELREAQRRLDSNANPILRILQAQKLSLAKENLFLSPEMFSTAAHDIRELEKDGEAVLRNLQYSTPDFLFYGIPAHESLSLVFKDIRPPQYVGDIIHKEYVAGLTVYSDPVIITHGRAMIDTKGSIYFASSAFRQFHSNDPKEAVASLLDEAAEKIGEISHAAKRVRGYRWQHRMGVFIFGLIIIAVIFVIGSIIAHNGNSN